MGPNAGFLVKMYSSSGIGTVPKLMSQGFGGSSSAVQWGTYLTPHTCTAATCLKEHLCPPQPSRSQPLGGDKLREGSHMQMLTSKNMGAQTAEVIFCFSVLNPPPSSRATVSITLNLTIPQDYFVIIHLSLPPVLFPNSPLPSSSSRTVFSLVPSALSRLILLIETNHSDISGL